MQRFFWVVLLVGLSSTMLSGQTSERDEEDIRGTTIALIDMAEAFKRSNKFVALRDGLKDDISQTDMELRKMGVKQDILKTELAKLSPGTPEAKEKQLELNALQQDANTFRVEAKRRLMATEARIYQQIFLEVSDVVKAIATERKLSIVFRFNRKPLDGLVEPGEILKAMNKQVIYAEQGSDITDEAVKRLNDKYEQATK